jgi:hypothetical protein
MELVGGGTDQPHPLHQSEYWNRLEEKATKAIDRFPEWWQSTRVIQKTGNLVGWLQKEFDLNTREVEFVKNILTDLFESLR